MAEKVSRARWRPRFTLIGLMALVAVCAIATQGYLAWQRHTALRDMRWAQAVFDEGAELQSQGQSIVRIYCQSSERLCQVESRTDRKAATRAHLERIILAQRRIIALEAVTLNGGSKDKIVVETCRQRAEELAASIDPRSMATLAAWKKLIDVDFVDTPWEDVLNHIEKTLGIKLRIEHVEPPRWEPPVTYSAKGVAMREVLRDLERHLGVTFIVDGDAMIVRVY